MRVGRAKSLRRRTSRVLWVAILAITFGCIRGYAQAASSTNGILTRGLQHIAELMHAGSFAEAEQAASKLHSQFPRSAAIEQEYAAALEAQHKISQATEHFQHAVALAPTSSAAHLNLGSNYFRRGMLKEARAQFRAACTLKPTDATALYNLGLADLQLETPSAALEDFQKAHKLEPQSIETSYYLAMTYVMAHRQSDALLLIASLPNEVQSRPEFLILKVAAETEGDQREKHFHTILENLGNEPKAYASASALFLTAGDSKHAAQVLEAATARFPQQARLEYLLAITYSRAEQNQTAIDTLKTALTHSDLPELHELYGKLLEEQGDSVSAEHELQRAAELDPSEANLYNLGSELLKHWTFDAAETVFQNGLKIHPDSQALRNGLAIAYFASGDYDRAVETVQSSRDARQPIDGDAMAVLMAAYPYSHAKASQVRAFAAAYAQQNPANAWASYYEALAIDDDPNHSATPTGGAEAIRLFQRAVSLEPKVAQFHYRLGVALAGAGEWETAAEALQQAVAIDDKLAEAWYRLALADKRIGKLSESEAAMARYTEVSDRKNSELQARMAQTKKFLSNGPH